MDRVLTFEDSRGELHFVRLSQLRFAVGAISEDDLNHEDDYIFRSGKRTKFVGTLSQAGAFVEVVRG